MIMSDNHDLQMEKNIKTWWSDNKFYLIGVISFALIAIVAKSNYQVAQINKTEKAATLYYYIVPGLKSENADVAIKQVNDLHIENPKSIYSGLSSLHLAKYYVEKQNYDEAIKELDWVIDNSNDNLKSVSKLKLARIYIELKKPEKALKTTNDNNFYTAENEIIKGDAYLKLGKLAQAKTAYKKSIDNCSKQSQYELWELANMKYNNINYVEPR
jgi:predicted negative regulator of RcsB-dependent stress response